MNFTKQGSALISDDFECIHKYEIQKSENEKFSLRVDGEVVHFFKNKRYAIKVANFIEEDANN